MAKLIDLSPAAGLLPLTIGTVALTEDAVGPVTSIAPFAGKTDEVGKVLVDAVGCGFPAPNRAENGKGAQVLWAGRGRALLIGVPAPEGLSGLAAVTDQSDASVWVTVRGARAEAVLARLVPLDLRVAGFPQGATARSFVNHMTAQITRTGAEAFQIACFRSMAATLVHELTEAAQAVAARG